MANFINKDGLVINDDGTVELWILSRTIEDAGTYERSIELLNALCRHYQKLGEDIGSSNYDALVEALKAMLTCQVGGVVYTPSEHAVKLANAALARVDKCGRP